MTKPNFITFTGADDSTDVAGMRELSGRYPIEWGILFSPQRQGQGRYPSIDFVRRLCVSSGTLRLSAHLCGGYSQSVLEYGVCGLEEPLSAHFTRVQINTASSVDLEHVAAWAADISLRPILQCRGAFPDIDPVGWLFDASGGRGIAPAAWPDPGPSSAMRGYAGGLNPGNVAEAVATIGAMCSNYWIDMETGVRDERDRFDLEKCRAVCEAVYGKEVSAA